MAEVAARCIEGVCMGTLEGGYQPLGRVDFHVLAILNCSKSSILASGIKLWVLGSVKSLETIDY